MTDVNNEVSKVTAYQAWKAGQSKASLALEFDVSPRTIGRWLEEVEAKGLSAEKKAPVVAAPVAPNAVDTRYLDLYIAHLQKHTNAELAETFGISESTVRRWIKKAEAEVVPTSSEVKVLAEEAPKVDATYRHVSSSKSISITEIRGGVTNTVSTDKTSSGFEDILDTLIDAKFSQEALADAFVLLQPAKVLEKFTQGKIQVDPKNRQIFYVADEDTVPYLVNNSLTTRVIDMLRNGQTGVSTLLNFLEKLMENPSRRAVEELYGFLQANDIEIAEDGDFYAWKKVRSDYLDIHSATMDNSPGNVLRVARNMVDEDSNRTCSYGLHVCSKSYLPNFGDSHSSRILKVKVNPSDVVAIPADYNNAKMRCAGYLVLEDVTDTMRQVVTPEWD